MLRLLKAEIFKLFKNKTFMVLCFVALAIAILNFAMTKLTSSEEFLKSSLTNMTEEEKNATIEQIKQMSTTDSVVTPGKIGATFQGKDMFNPKSKELFHTGFGQGIIEILLAILIGALVAKEYSSGTIKNMLAYGKRRRDYYLAKFLAISIGGVILLTIMVLSFLILSIIVFPWGEAFNLSELIHIFRTFIVGFIAVMSIISLIMLLATLLKSNGSTIGIGISLFVLAPTAFSFLYGKYSWFDRIYESTASYNYVLGTALKASNNDIGNVILISVITTIVSLFLGISLLNKQDIK